MSAWAWEIASSLGSPVVIFLLALAFFTAAEEMERFIPRRMRMRMRKASKLVMLSVIISIALVLGLKALTTHVRPCMPCSGSAEACNQYCPPLPGTSGFSWPGDYSFPSGHAAVAFAAAAGLYASIGKKKYAIIFLLPTLISISRVMLGVHTTWDVIAGAAVGLASADIAELALDKKRPNRR